MSGLMCSLMSYGWLIGERAGVRAKPVNAMWGIKGSEKLISVLRVNLAMIYRVFT